MPKENNSYLKMKEYFEDLVNKSTLVKSFAGFFERDVINQLDKDSFESPFIAINGYELSLTGPEQNTIGVRKFNFAVLYSNVPDDIELQYKAIDDAEKIILKFIARIKLDSCNPEHFLYNSFKKDDIIILPDDLFMNCFGAYASITFHTSQSLKASAEDWTDDFLTC